MDLAGFRLQFPEFASCTSALVQQYLDTAANEVNPDVFNTWYDRAHGFLTAHLLCLAPNGQMSRLVAKDGSTTYGKQYENLRAAMICGDRSW